MSFFDRWRRKPEKSSPDQASEDVLRELAGAAPDIQESSTPSRGATSGTAGDGQSGPGGGGDDDSDEAEEAPRRGGILAGLRKALKKTADLLRTDIRDLFGVEGRLLDDQLLQELYATLIKTDMGTAPATEIREEIQRQYRGRKVKFADILEVVKARFRELLKQEEAPIELRESGPTVIMVVGVNGSGKTTSIAKLARHFHGLGKKVVLGAGDTFRAAAVEQLTIWAQRIGVEIVSAAQGSDPASVAHRAVAAALARQADVCIIDTAGRLQSQANLMQELEKIRRVVSKQIPDAPHEVTLVLDATAGQNGISQARGFSDAVQCTGLFLTKLDGTAKGGVVIPIHQQFHLPVRYIGVGEKDSDIEVFNVDRFVDALFE